MMTIPRTDHSMEFVIDMALLTRAPARYMASKGVPFQLALRIVTRPDLRRNRALNQP